jgi:uncharacterized protein (DUF1330 family)
MPTYGLAHLRTPQLNADVFEYLRRVQATLDPCGGRFIVHGGTVEVREGTWPGTVVIVEFPSAAAAREWYDSPEYQKILPLRTKHIEGDLIIVDGVEPGHDSGRMADKLEAAARR